MGYGVYCPGLAKRARELDELYTKIRVVSGFTAEQILDMFLAGYTLKEPEVLTLRELAKED